MMISIFTIVCLTIFIIILWLYTVELKAVNKSFKAQLKAARSDRDIQKRYASKYKNEFQDYYNKLKEI